MGKIADPGLVSVDFIGWRPVVVYRPDGTAVLQIEILNRDSAGLVALRLSELGYGRVRFAFAAQALTEDNTEKKPMDK